MYQFRSILLLLTLFGSTLSAAGSVPLPPLSVGEPIIVPGVNRLIISEDQAVQVLISGKRYHLRFLGNQDLDEGVIYKFESIVAPSRAGFIVLSVEPLDEIIEHPFSSRSAFAPDSLTFGQRVTLLGEFIITL